MGNYLFNAASPKPKTPTITMNSTPTADPVSKKPSIFKDTPKRPQSKSETFKKKSTRTEAFTETQTTSSASLFNTSQSTVKKGSSETDRIIAGLEKHSTFRR